ncbi:hypothetical protein DAMA08_040150 [Martiniozyma asiatica (nom. inval.)]|nr:hypothetical protein DAMA08_040150 [Martiniozyma asiatica]
MKDSKVKRPHKTCSRCRARKVKCDRNKPCFACVHSGVPDQCIYESLKPNVQPSKIIKSNNLHIKNSSDNLGSYIERFTLTSNPDVSSPEDASSISSQFDLPFLSFKKEEYKNSIIDSYNGGVCKYYGPLSPKAIFEGNQTFTKLKNLADSFIQTEIGKSSIGVDRKWNTKLDEIEVTHSLHNRYSEIEISEMIQNIIIPQYKGARERLNYFNTNQFNFLTELIPIDDIFKYLDQWFVLSKVDDVSADTDPLAVKILRENNVDFQLEWESKYVFNPPKNKSQYALLSLAVSIIQMVLLFENIPQNTFQNAFVDSNKNCEKLALACLSVSKYEENPSIYALTALIILEKNMLITSMANTENIEKESYFVHKHSVNVAFKLGIHINCDTFVKDGISGKSIQTLWNYMQLLDVFYTILFGNPVQINENYCKSRLLPEFEELTQNFRYICKTFSGFDSISINDMLKCTNILSNHVSKYEGLDTQFGLLNNENVNFLQILERFLSTTVFEFILYKIRYILENEKYTISQLPYDEKIAVDSIKSQCENQLAKIVLSSFMLLNNTITNVINGSGNETCSLNFFLSTRISMTRYFIISCISIFDFEPLDSENSSDEIGSYIRNSPDLKSMRAFPLVLKMLEQTSKSAMDLLVYLNSADSKYIHINDFENTAHELKTLICLQNLVSAILEQGSYEEIPQEKIWMVDSSKWKNITHNANKSLDKVRVNINDIISKKDILMNSSNYFAENNIEENITAGLFDRKLEDWYFMENLGYDKMALFEDNFNELNF